MSGGTGSPTLREGGTPRTSSESPSRGGRWRRFLGSRTGVAVAIVMAVTSLTLDIREIVLERRARAEARQDEIAAVAEQLRTASDSSLPTVAANVDRLLGRYPTSTELKVLRGLIHARERELEMAEADFREVLRKEPDDVQSLLGLGAVLVDLERPSEAIPYLDQAWESYNGGARVSIRQEKANILLHLVRAHLSDGQLDEARHQLLQWETLGLPPSPDAHRMMGHIHRMKKDYRAAADAYAAGLALATHDPSLAQAYVQSLLDAGRLEAEVERLEGLVAVDPAQLHEPMLRHVLPAAYRLLGRDAPLLELQRRVEGQ